MMWWVELRCVMVIVWVLWVLCLRYVCRILLCLIWNDEVLVSSVVCRCL